MDKTTAFLKDGTTLLCIRNTLLKHRNETTGNIDLASHLVEALANHVPRVTEPITHYITKIALCSFKQIDGRFVLDHETVQDLGWFASDSADGINGSGFWNIDKLTGQMYSPSYSRYGHIPNPTEKRMPSNKQYNCAVSRTLPVFLSEDFARLVQVAPIFGMFVTKDSDLFKFLPNG